MWDDESFVALAGVFAPAPLMMRPEWTRKTAMAPRSGTLPKVLTGVPAAPSVGRTQALVLCALKGYPAADQRHPVIRRSALQLRDPGQRKKPGL